MAPCDSQSSTQPKPVVEIKLEIKRPDGQVQNGEPLSTWRFSSLLRASVSDLLIDTLRLYSNDRMRIGRDKDHK